MKHIFVLFLMNILLLGIGAKAQEALKMELKGHIHAINALAFSPDGNYLVSASGNQNSPSRKSQCIVWDLNTGEKLLEIAQHPEEIRSLTFSPDGSQIITAGGYQAKQNFKIWDFGSGKEIATRIGHNGINSIATNAKGKVMVTGGLDKFVKIWNLPKGEIMHALKGHTTFISEVALSQYGTYTASAAANLNTRQGEIKIWDTQTGRLLQDLSRAAGAHMHGVNSIDFSPDERWLVSGSEEGSFKIWEVSTGKLYKDFSDPGNAIVRVRFSPDGKFVAVAGKNEPLKIWEISSGQCINTYQGHTAPIRTLAYSPDGKLVASAGEDRIIKVWRSLSNRQLAEVYVKMHMEDWYQRGKFEKSEDYEARLSNTDLKSAKVHQLLQEFSQKLAEDYFYPSTVQGKKRYTFQLQNALYDPDNEVFRLDIENLATVLMQIPIKEARAFDACLGSLAFYDCTFGMDEQDNLVLASAQIHCPNTDTSYPYLMQALPFEVPLSIQAVLDERTLNYLNAQNNGNTTAQASRIISTSTSEVDFNLPKSRMRQPDAVAVVIGNALYQKTSNVDFALNDARSMRNYLIQVMGYRPENIIYLENASYTDMKLVFGSKENHKGKLFNMVKPDRSEVFVYYSGHGAPGLNNKAAYFVPVECDPQYVELTGFPAEVFYDNLAKLPARSVVVALDACFSGQNIYTNISPIVIRSKGALGLKSGALLASSAADQVSAWYPEKRHGLFTYFFLKAIHNQNADSNKDGLLTLAEIHAFLNDASEGIPYYARRLHGITQSPVISGQNIQKVLVDFR